ncbi:hypothetical protein VPHD51_0162 [Vibrio phage D51]
MDIYVDGSTHHQKNTGGFAVVTDDAVYIKAYGKAPKGYKRIGITYCETEAFIMGLELAKTGDCVNTDQCGIVTQIREQGQYVSNRIRLGRSYCHSRRLDRVMAKKEGIAFDYYSSKTAKKKSPRHPANLADMAAKVASETLQLNILQQYIGKRKVVLL